MPPRIDLHRHLDGNIRIQTILDLAEKNGITLPVNNVEGLRPHVTITSPHPGLLEFLEKFRWSMAVLATPDDCRRIARENVEDAKRERLDYVELRFSPWFMASAHRLNPEAVVEAVAAGIAEGVRDFGIPVNLIGILSRTFGPAVCFQELAALMTCRDQLVGLDLAGDEAGFPARLFASHFEKARNAGLQITVHAGEAAGPESIREAIDLLGAARIGHGVRAIDDPALMEELSRRGIGIECCLTSNVQTSTVASYSVHPLRHFLQQGLLATINTDDPGISGITLDHEFEMAAPQAGLSPAHILQAKENAARLAWGGDFAR
ncbi:MAG: adenosine deaminase [Terrimicrobiaceae bacterium]